MSVINLMLLGFLMEKPMNAYEIKKEVENRNLTWWIKGSSPSIYRNVNNLSNKGYIDGKVVREGEMPEKTIYTINANGKQYFSELMKKYSNEPPQVYFDFAAVISNIGKVDQETGKLLIDNLCSAFDKNRSILKSVENNYKPIQAKSVVQLAEEMYDLFCVWLKKLEEELYPNSGTSK
jgi:Predicted transcriptional regulators